MSIGKGVLKQKGVKKGVNRELCVHQVSKLLAHIEGELFCAV